MLREPQVRSIPEGRKSGEGGRQTSEMASGLPADSLGEAEEVQGAGGGEERMGRGLPPWGGRQGPP